MILLNNFYLKLYTYIRSTLHSMKNYNRIIIINRAQHLPSTISGFKETEIPWKGMGGEETVGWVPAAPNS
jgi:hypothetical protein